MVVFLICGDLADGSATTRGLLGCPLLYRTAAEGVQSQFLICLGWRKRVHGYCK